MREAVNEASKAIESGEVPIGCVIVYKDEIIGRGHNLRNSKKNPLCHAEISAINEAACFMGDWRLEECTLYVTVEPCPMCAGAIVQARIPRVVFGTPNVKAGCAGSIPVSYTHLSRPANFMTMTQSITTPSQKQ